MKKILIVSGCSFTDKNFVSLSNPNYDCSFTKWPELLAEKLNMDCINLGSCGAGNDYIYNSLLEEIIRRPKEEIGLVIAAWSQVQRVDWQEYGKFAPNGFSYKDYHNDNMIWRNKRLGKEGNVFYWMLDHLRRIVSFDSLCKSHNIPYKQFQMLTPFDAWLNGLMKTDFEIKRNAVAKVIFGKETNFVNRYKYKSILSNANEDLEHLLKLMLKYEKYIDTKNFLGWPVHLRLGGYAVEQKVMMTLPVLNNITELMIGGYDYHPNKKGHEKIAEFLYGQLENRLQK